MCRGFRQMGGLPRTPTPKVPRGRDSRTRQRPPRSQVCQAGLLAWSEELDLPAAPAHPGQGGPGSFQARVIERMAATSRDSCPGRLGSAWHKGLCPEPLGWEREGEGPSSCPHPLNLTNIPGT